MNIRFYFPSIEGVLTRTKRTAKEHAYIDIEVMNYPKDARKDLLSVQNFVFEEVCRNGWLVVDTVAYNLRLALLVEFVADD